MSKSIYFLAAVAAVSSILVGCGGADKANKPITMITEAGFPPYEYLEGEQIVGVDVDICRAVAEALGRDLVIQDAKFDAVIPSVLAGKADLAAAGITVTVTDNTKLKVEGINKQVVGQFAAEVRGYYPPEPYKGKGVHYVGEYIRRKEGKSVGK